MTTRTEHWESRTVQERAEIIRRANCHADLVAALKKAWSAVVVAQAEGFSCPGLQDEIEAALAKAGE